MAALLLCIVGCGGGGGSAGPSSRVDGIITSASTSAVDSPRRIWVAWVAETVVGLARRAYAAAAGSNTTLNGITVTVAAGGRQQSQDTDSGGFFSIDQAPTGDVTVSFRRGACSGTVPLSDVEDSSHVSFNRTTVDCNTVTPQSIGERFEGILQGAPGAQSGTLQVCAFAAGVAHPRAVATDSGTAFENSDGSSTSFSEFRQGDLIEATGTRAGTGPNTTLNAGTIRRIAASQASRCRLPDTPTPAPTATPRPSPTKTPAS